MCPIKLKLIVEGFFPKHYPISWPPISYNEKAAGNADQFINVEILAVARRLKAPNGISNVGLKRRSRCTETYFGCCQLLNLMKIRCLKHHLVTQVWKRLSHTNFNPFAKCWPIWLKILVWHGKKHFEIGFFLGTLIYTHIHRFLRHTKTTNALIHRRRTGFGKTSNAGEPFVDVEWIHRRGLLGNWRRYKTGSYVPAGIADPTSAPSQLVVRVSWVIAE